MRLIGRSICGLLWLVLACVPTAAAKRIAFAVGVDRYDNLGNEQQLKRAVSDARAMARTFKELQFEVVEDENVTREGFYVAWQRFLSLIAPGDTAAVFFAGHGIEMRGSNFLMPRDVPAAAKGELVLRSAGMPLADILDQLEERKPGTSLVILDACRNNPFSASGRSLGGARGLARVDERPGTLIIYSAGIGQIALDSVPDEPTASNSVFTHTLVPLLKTPGLDLLDVAKQTQRRVDALARRGSHTQTPAFYSQLLTDVYLAGAPAIVAPPSSADGRVALNDDRKGPAAAEIFKEPPPVEFVTRKGVAAGGKGGEPFDERYVNLLHAPITGLNITVTKSVADRNQRLIGRLQVRWNDLLGPVHGGGPADVSTAPVQFAQGETIRRVIIFHKRFTWPDPDNAPVWVSGLQVHTTKSAYTFGHADGTATECVPARGEQITGFFGRSGSYIDQLGCLFSKPQP